VLQVQELALRVNASPSLSSINVAGSLPAREISILVEGDQSVPVTGQASVPDKPAQGVAHFRNLTTSVVGVPAGTVICTTTEPVVKFLTMQDGVLEAGVDKTLDIPIRAVEPGPGGNLTAATLIAIEGSLGTELAVTNPEPTSGGTERTVAVPTADDRARLNAALLAELRQQALDQLSNQISAGDLLFPDTLVVARILDEIYRPVEGQPGETLTLTMKGKFSIQYAQASDLNALAAAALAAGLTMDKLPVTDTVTVEIVEPPISQAGGATTFSFHASQMLKPNINLSSVARAVQGLSPSEAIQRLGAMFPLVSPPQIELIPSWWPWLPLLQFRITIKV